MGEAHLVPPRQGSAPSGMLPWSSHQCHAKQGQSSRHLRSCKGYGGVQVYNLGQTWGWRKWGLGAAIPLLWLKLLAPWMEGYPGAWHSQRKKFPSQESILSLGHR